MNYIIPTLNKYENKNKNPSTYLRFLFSLCSCRRSDSKLLKEILSSSTVSSKSILCVWRKLISRNIRWLRNFSFSMEHLYFQNTFITSTLPGVSAKTQTVVQCTWKSVHFCMLVLKAAWNSRNNYQIWGSQRWAAVHQKKKNLMMMTTIT